jgi:GT2 family glycosyltransferase
VDVVVSTHTTRHLRRTLMGVACQTRQADHVVLTCDTDSPELVDAARGAAEEFGLALTLVRRPHAGVARSGQVRNNGVRVLLQADPPVDPCTLLVFFDGDMIPAHDCVESHARLAASGADLVIGFRVDLTPEQTDAISEPAIRAGSAPIEATRDQLSLLRSREARYRRQLLLRRLGLAKAHKPKILSANFSVRLDAYLAINGFDERFEGYGQEDDDLGRRLHQHGCRAALGITRCMAYHQYHQTRAPGAWGESPMVSMLHASAPTRCVLGVDRAREQSQLLVERFGPAACVAAS